MGLAALAERELPERIPVGVESVIWLRDTHRLMNILLRQNTWIRTFLLVCALGRLSPAFALEGIPETPHPLPAVLGAPPEPHTFLMPDQAFRISADNGANPGSLILSFTPAPGYYLYRDRIHLRLPGVPQEVPLRFPVA